MEKRYRNDEITVIWQPDLCTHSTNCWRGLIKVFNPKKRPWIDMAGADTAAIIAQVAACPSGALSYERNDAEPAVAQEAATPAEPAAAPPAATIEVMPNGPLLVRTPSTIVHRDGTRHERPHTVALCRCGASKSKPYCDGSHSSIKFSDEPSA